ncbi:unnamed protein product [Parascedosporium putredinis]|uniref:Complex 1 LYR protein domain-containing protein n=1 Tax=Parascedosporium putredinis TaxID=1442378 RepID=A0A9P1H0C5_9PEZI|nr:unnamed protein product [Parascedosporium putredinis]CAI7991653.1 unnamed protein product [Parascedosporium putredinis]
MLTLHVPIPLSRHAVSPRHLYRHLLREASYLPPISAPYVATRIREKFREHMHSEDQIRSPPHFWPSRTLRRTLMARLVRPEPPTSSVLAASEDARSPKKNKEDARATEVYNKAKQNPTTKKGFIDYWDMVKLQAYTSSQVQHAASGTPPVVWRRGPPTKTLPVNTIPEKNIWGRPTPVRAIRSLLKSWWLRNLPRPIRPAQGVPNPLSSKKMRRLCGNVLQVSSIVKEDDGTGKGYRSRVKWGTLTPDLPTAKQTTFFEGVDSTGAAKRAPAKNNQDNAQV